MLSKVWQLFLRDARTALSYPLSFWSQWIAIPLGVTGMWFVSKLIPPSHHFGFAGHSGTYFSYVVINLAFLGFQSTAVSAFQSAVQGSQSMGVVEALLVTPTDLPLLIVSSTLWSFTLTAARVVVYLLSAILVFHLDLSQANPGAILLSLALIVTCMSAFGIFSAASVMTFKQPSPTGLVLGSVSQLLGGVFFPIALLPLWLRHVSQILPITHGLGAIRAAAHGATLAQMEPDLVWLACASVVLLPLALFAFHRSVGRAKYDGTLGQY